MAAAGKPLVLFETVVVVVFAVEEQLVLFETAVVVVFVAVESLVLSGTEVVEFAPVVVGSPAQPAMLFEGVVGLSVSAGVEVVAGAAGGPFGQAVGPPAQPPAVGQPAPPEVLSVLAAGQLAAVVAAVPPVSTVELPALAAVVGQSEQSKVLAVVVVVAAAAAERIVPGLGQ